MDFFERVFHISPDGGSGSLETLYILVFVGVVAVAAASAVHLRRRAARRYTDRR